MLLLLSGFAKKLPTGWVETTLGEVRADRSTGISTRDMAGQTLDLYSVPALERGKPDTLAGSEIGSNKVVVGPGDVLLCGINPRINRVWVVGERTEHPQIASTEWIVFSRTDGLVSEYLAHFLRQDHVRNYLATNVSGVGGSLMRVRAPVVDRLPFPLAPTAEQERIVAKLDATFARLDAGEKALRRGKERLKRYRACVLNAAVTGELTKEWRKERRETGNSKLETGEELLKRLLVERRKKWEAAELAKMREMGKEPKDDRWKARYPEPQAPETAGLPRLPKGWTWATVDQLACHITSGSRGWAALYVERGAMFVRAQNISQDELRLTDVAFVNPPANTEGLRTAVQQHDVLLTITGANVTKAARVESNIDEAYVNQHVALIRPICEQLSPWLHTWMVTPGGGRRILLADAYGAGKPGLSLVQVRELPTPVPPLREQGQIAGLVQFRLSAADRLAAAMDRQLAAIRQQRQAILRDAFAGRLVPQDPAAEPASALLACLAAERQHCSHAADSDNARRKRHIRSRSSRDPEGRSR